jgi:hypothetical protein
MEKSFSHFASAVRFSPFGTIWTVCLRDTHLFFVVISAPKGASFSCVRFCGSPVTLFLRSADLLHSLSAFAVLSSTA